MTRKALWVMCVAIGMATLFAALVSAWRVSEHGQQARRLDLLRARVATLHDSLSAILARDPLVEFARDDSSEIAVALSESLLVTILQDIAARYLDRVELDLKPVRGHGEGEFKFGTPLGRMTVGEWRVNVRTHEIAGVLSAGTPGVAVSGTNRVRLAIPIQIHEGRGAVTLAFKWDSRSIFNIICRDFQTVQTVQGTILPQQHVVQGHVVLTADAEGIVANPDFPPEKFPLSMTLTEPSWERLRVALEKQDKLFKCGVIMNPDAVIHRLRDLAFRGLRFKLPRRAFRTIALPASILQSVQILKSPVQLSVEPNQLRISPGLLWYSAEIDVRHPAGPDSLLGPAGSR